MRRALLTLALLATLTGWGGVAHATYRSPPCEVCGGSGKCQCAFCRAGRWVGLKGGRCWFCNGTGNAGGR